MLNQVMHGMHVQPGLRPGNMNAGDAAAPSKRKNHKRDTSTAPESNVAVMSLHSSRDQYMEGCVVNALM